MPRGGARVGAGRPPKDPTLAALHGSRQRSARATGAEPAAPVEVVDPPRDLRGAALKVWLELAPFALEERTLTAATVVAFAMLCRAVVLERTLGRGHEKASAKHRGMMQRVESGLRAFRLAPMGKQVSPPKPAPDAFAEFDAPTDESAPH